MKCQSLRIFSDWLLVPVVGILFYAVNASSNKQEKPSTLNFIYTLPNRTAISKTNEQYSTCSSEASRANHPSPATVETRADK